MQKEFIQLEPQYSIKTPSSLQSSVDSENYVRGFPQMQTYNSHHTIESFSDDFAKKQNTFSSNHQSLKQAKTTAKEVKQQLMTQIKKYEQQAIQKKKAKKLMNRVNQETKLFTHSFLTQIENQMFEKNNFELFTEIMTKEKDSQYKFKRIIETEKMNIRNILSQFEMKDLRRSITMVQKGEIAIDQLEDDDMLEASSSGISKSSEEATVCLYAPSNDPS